MLVVESREEETWFLTIRLLSTAESDPLQDPPATEAWGNWPDRLTSGCRELGGSRLVCITVCGLECFLDGCTFS